ncbi:MAG TPA: 2-hydroxyacyl-CoA dehydratase [Oscillospiraceae bacterium]|nr:2-hydroxyacyl-CoA dehydratase [Oscillospiraceae bacterium]
MKVTFPHMGSLSIALEGLLTDLGLEIVIPPPITKKTINLGVLNAPEFACFPLKITLGNFIEGLEAGADTVVMLGGTGPCRLGYYAEVQKEILRDLGYDFEMIVLEPPQGKVTDLTDELKKLCGTTSWAQMMRALHTVWRKVKALDKLHALSLQVRAREVELHATTKAYQKSIALLREAQTPAAVNQKLRQGLAILKAVPQDRQKSVLRLGLVGEIYMLLEPFANLEVEKILGEMGVEVERSLYISEWMKEHLLLSSMRLKGGLAVKRAAEAYLNNTVGGHGWESIGATVRYARRGYDGVIHILPFTCTPEIVAQSILPTVSKEQGIPVLSFSLDEQSGEAGFKTRLEAFLDLLEQRKKTWSRV